MSDPNAEGVEFEPRPLEAEIGGEPVSTTAPVDTSLALPVPPGVADASPAVVSRRSEARRSADQNDMLSDDPGEDRSDRYDDPDRPRPSTEWDRERSATRIGSELRRIEAEVRRILDGHDLKRKRKMAGTRRWHELEEDIIAWRFSGRIEDELLVRLKDLVARRHHVFRRLRFIASTRPTWNS